MYTYLSIYGKENRIQKIYKVGEPKGTVGNMNILGRDAKRELNLHLVQRIFPAKHLPPTPKGGIFGVIPEWLDA